MLHDAYQIDFKPEVLDCYEISNFNSEQVKYNCNSILKYLSQTNGTFASFSDTLTYFNHAIFKTNCIKSSFCDFTFENHYGLIKSPFEIDFKDFKFMRNINDDSIVDDRVLYLFMFKSGALSIPSKSTHPETYRTEIANRDVLCEFKRLDLFLPVDPDSKFKDIAAEFESLFDMIINAQDEKHCNDKIQVIQDQLENHLKKGPTIIWYHPNYFKQEYGIYANEDFCRNLVKSILRCIKKINKLSTEERHEGIQPDVVLYYNYDYVIYFEIKCNLPQVPVKNSDLAEQVDDYLSVFEDHNSYEKILGFSMKFFFPRKEVSIKYVTK